MCCLDNAQVLSLVSNHVRLARIHLNQSGPHKRMGRDKWCI